VDVWSLGVVLFAMVTGYLPFHASGNKQELCQKIVRGQFECPEGLSAEVTDLLHRMLTVDPAARITFDEIMVRMDLRHTNDNNGEPESAS
jgi:5'-AMP-activated protein kinase catalytic alpha subunit